MPIGVSATELFNQKNAVIPADIIRIIDGDTVEVRAYIWLGQTIITRVRMANIDAPELRARCPEEKEKAIAAKLALKKFLAEKLIMLKHVRQDKYGGRVVADIYNFQGKNASAYMLEQGHARHYAGGRRDQWCS